MRFFLVLVCGALVFAAVYIFAPGFIELLLRRAANAPAADSQSGADQTSKAGRPDVQKKPANARAGSIALPVADSTAAPRGPEIRTSPRTSASLSGSGLPVGPVFSVADETATLYYTNASSGPVVRGLRKGDVVEPKFRLLSAGQDWLFVTLGDPEVSGFLRSDAVEIWQAAEQTSR